jgi:hypothetical protein
LGIRQDHLEQEQVAKFKKTIVHPELVDWVLQDPHQKDRQKRSAEHGFFSMQTSMMVPAA